MFVSLHNHDWGSNLSGFIDSINKPLNMVQKALELGYKGIAITNHDCLSSHIEWLKCRDKIKETNPDFKIILGNEIYLIDKEKYKNTKDYYHFILIAKDETGYKQLKELSSRAWDRSYIEKGIRRKPTFYQDLEEIIGKNPGHIIGSSACFTKGHQIQTLAGFKNIEDIQTGDLVLTHTGEIQKVLNPTKRKYKDIGYQLSFRHNDQKIVCTKNHKFLVYHLKQIQRNPTLFTRELIWKEAQDLKRKDKTLGLMPTYKYSNIQRINIKHIIDQYHKQLPPCSLRYHLKTIVSITPELMRLYGLWLGDGSVSAENSANNIRVTLSFNEKEFDYYYPFVKKGIKSLGNFNLLINYDRKHHKVECVINSAELSYLLRYISNDGKSDTKFIHPSLKHISKEMDAEILYGYLLADGYFRRRAIKMSGYYSDETVDATVSQNLFNDITELYYSVGFVPRFLKCQEHIKNNVHHKDSFYHTVACGPFSLKCNKKNILSHKELIKYFKERIQQHAKGKIIIYNNVKYLLRTVKNINPIHLNETVYCLNIDKDHSFICNGIIVHNCLGSELDKAILNHDVKKANNFVRRITQIFGAENVSLELQPSDNPDQIKVNKILIQLAKFYNLNFIVTTDSHYLEKNDLSIFTSWLNSKSSSDREVLSFYKYTYLMSIEEIKQILMLGISKEDAESAVNNTEKIYKMITDFDMRHATIVPTINLPKFTVNHILKKWYDKYPFIRQVAFSKSQQDQYMLYQIEEGIKNRHFIVGEKEAARLNEEFEVILYISEQLKQDISAYLNLVNKVMDICWQTSILGTGRGSAGSFLINYLMGITQVNPLQFNIPSFRFLNKARSDSLPDIDFDTAPEQTDNILKLLRKYFGENNVLNCATFKTETLKSCILTVGRGLRFNNDDMQSLASLVPSVRGMSYNLNQCIKGDEEKELPPVPNFESKIKSYPGLFEGVIKLEGLISGVSIHASALYIFKKGYLEHNSLMRAPNGIKITCWNMHDSDDCSALKLDLLRTNAESKIMKAMELLLKAGQIQWQGSLRNTFNKYFHPDVLIYNNPSMWQEAYDLKICDLFQMDTACGSLGIKKMKPQTVEELAAVNGLIRLTGETGEETAVDRYVRFKNNIQEWYDEMNKWGLTEDEKEILKSHIGSTYGVNYNQDRFMLMLQDPEIGNLTLKEADKARKILAKKKINEIAGFKKQFFDSKYKSELENNKDIKHSRKFKEYVYDKMIKPQMTYSFNLAHGISYSLIGLCEINIATRWNKLFWETACLSVNAGTGLNDFSENENEDSEQGEGVCVPDQNEESGTPEVRHVAPNYKKIAKALDDAQRSGVKIALPNINTAEIDFTPDIEHNAIRYSLAAINVVSDDLLNKILSLRPFKSITEFYTKVEPTNAQMLGLIKAGCFDELEKQPRHTILRKFLRYLANQEYPLKDKLTTVHVKRALDLGLKLEKYNLEIRLYHFKKYIDKNQVDKENRRYIFTDESCIKFFTTYIQNQLNLSKGEYSYMPDGNITIKQSVFKRFFDKNIENLMTYLNSEEGRKTYQNVEQEDFINGLLEKYCQGDLSAWEMDTMCFYYSGHELKNINEVKYNIRDFNKLPEMPAGREFVKDGHTYMAYDLCAIAGTVIGTDNNRHIVTLSTTHGVVNVKLYSGVYNQYNAKISVIDPKTKKKIVVDDSFFKRGNKILVYGYRRENQFIGKKQYSGGYTQIIGLITDVFQTGEMKFRFNRNKKI